MITAMIMSARRQVTKAIVAWIEEGRRRRQRPTNRRSPAACTAGEPGTRNPAGQKPG